MYSPSVSSIASNTQKNVEECVHDHASIISTLQKVCERLISKNSILLNHSIMFAYSRVGQQCSTEQEVGRYTRPRWLSVIRIERKGAHVQQTVPAWHESWSNECYVGLMEKRYIHVIVKKKYPYTHLCLYSLGNSEYCFQRNAALPSPAELHGSLTSNKIHCHVLGFSFAAEWMLCTSSCTRGAEKTEAYADFTPQYAQSVTPHRNKRSSIGRCTGESTRDPNIDVVW